MPQEARPQLRLTPLTTSAPYPCKRSVSSSSCSSDDSLATLDTPRSEQNSPWQRRKPIAMQLDLATLQQIKEPTAPTNTLILTNLHPSLFTADALAQLRSALAELVATDARQHEHAQEEKDACIRYWIPLKSFTRVVVALDSTTQAQALRARLQGTLLHGQPVRIFYAQAMDSFPIAQSKLQVPPLERNWLISPPGSPPVGWQPAREDPPNAHTHETDWTGDLQDRLAKLPLETGLKTPTSPAETPVLQRAHNSTFEPGPLSRRRSVTLLERSAIGPGIVVHMEEQEQDSVLDAHRLQEDALRKSLHPTARPPLF